MYIIVFNIENTCYWTFTKDDGKIGLFDNYKEAKKIGEQHIKENEVTSFDVFKKR